MNAHKTANASILRLGMPIVLIAIFQLPLIQPFFHSDFFPTHDNVQTVRIFEYYQGLQYESFPPRWSAGLLYGYGYPLFTFYGPFSYLLGSLFVLLGADFLVATKLTFIFSFFIGSIGMFFLLRLFTNNIAALFGSILYSLTPYRAAEAYVRGDLAEFLALSLFPWILLLNIKLLKSPKSRLLTGLLGLILSVLVITHSLSVFIFVAFLIPFNIFYIFRYTKKDSPTILPSLITSAIIALLVSSFYWLPIIIESRSVQLGKFVSYPYAKYFVTPSQLWQTTWGYGGFTEASPMSLQIGQVVLVTSFLTFALNSLIKTKHRDIIFFFTLILILSILFETKISEPVWKRTPFFISCSSRGDFIS